MPPWKMEGEVGMKYYGTAWKLFLRYVRFWAITILLFLVTNLLCARMFLLDFWLNDYLKNCDALGFLGLTLFSFLGYEYLLLPETAHCRETITAIPGGTWKLFLAQLAVLVPLAGLWSGNILVWMLMGFPKFSTDLSSGLSLCCAGAVLDLFFPSLIGLLLGSVLALRVRRSTAYCLLMIFSLLTGPVLPQIFKDGSLGGFSVYTILDWFSLATPYSSFLADGMYLFPLELCRWALAGAWLMGLCALGAFWLPKAKATRRLALLIALLAAGLAVRFQLRDGDCVIRRDYRMDGAVMGEVRYRDSQEQPPERAADFTVKTYDLDLRIKSGLEAEATLTLSQLDLNVYRFTLYHDLALKKVTDGGGNPLEYQREGDYITVNGCGDGTLIFHYSGSVGKYFCNAQAICLPGYVPYYPIPGHISFWDADARCVAVRHDQMTALFRVRVDSPLTVYSNLPQTDDGLFTGETGALTLYAGIVGTEQKGENRIYYPILDPVRVENLAGLEPVWAALAARVGETRPLETAGKPVFVLPFTIQNYVSPQENAVVLEDQILLFQVEPDRICRSYLLSLLPAQARKEPVNSLYLALEGYLSNPEGLLGPYSDENPPKKEDFEILLTYDPSSADENEFFAWAQASDNFRYALAYQAEKLGEEKVLPKVYAYLQETEHGQDPVEFLFTLGERSDD